MCQRIVLGTIGRVRGRGLDMRCQRRLIDIRVVPTEPADDLAAAERLVKLADALLELCPDGHNYQFGTPLLP